MEQRPAINRYARQNRGWEMGDIFAVQLYPTINMKHDALSQAYLHVTLARNISSMIPFIKQL